ETTIPRGELVYGFGLLDRLYLRNGTLYVVTSTPSNFPQKKHIIARPLDRGDGRDLNPTDRVCFHDYSWIVFSWALNKELQIIDPIEATTILGDHALVVEGFSLIVTDTDQFMSHFYHFWGEIMLGAWRVISTLSSTSTSPSFITRVLLPHITDQKWKDPAGLNAAFMRATFPSTSIENSDQWEDLARLDKTFVFEHAMIVSRVAAHTHKLASSWSKMISSTMVVDVPYSFWESIRHTTVQNVLGYLPGLDNRGVVVSPPNAMSDVPIVTYVVRQRSRRLAEADHKSLSKALKELEWSGLCEVHVVHMEEMSLAQQVEVMARSTILIGVHGNGLTHQLWMPPSSRSTVVEIVAPPSYIYDYEILARNMGHKHYAVWNDTLKTFPHGEWFEPVNYTPDFHGVSIPVHAPTIAALVRERLRSLP
ncbi:hypothetical protein C0991_005387, partial [Blastosporella zonata]